MYKISHSLCLSCLVFSLSLRNITKILFVRLLSNFFRPHLRGTFLTCSIDFDVHGFFHRTGPCHRPQGRYERKAKLSSSKNNRNHWAQEPGNSVQMSSFMSAVCFWVCFSVGWELEHTLGANLEAFLIVLCCSLGILFLLLLVTDCELLSPSRSSILFLLSVSL